MGEAAIRGLQAVLADLIYDPRLVREHARGWSWVGFALCAALAVIGFQIGAKTYLENLDRAQFYQSYFSPAVALACTGELAFARDEEVFRFVADREGVFSHCDRVAGAITDEWSAFDASAVYLYALTAASWRAFGFEWASVFAIIGLFAAMYAIGAYLFVRCFCASRILAFALALAALYAAPVVGQMPHVRDFAKAPLILMAIGSVGYVVTHALSFRWMLIAAGFAGVMMGIGRGIRSDVIMIAPVALVLFALLWRGGENWRDRVGQTLCAVLAMFVGYVTAAAPAIAINIEKGAVTDAVAHVLILGFAERFYDVLGMAPADYAILREYMDEQVGGVVGLYNSGAGALTTWLTDASYGPPSYSLFGQILAKFPHDAFLRIFYTANYLGAFSINNMIYGPIMLGVLLAACVTLWRQAVLFVLVAGMMVAILSLQVHPRHAFYAVVLGAACFGLLATLAVEALRLAYQLARARSMPPLGRVGMRAAVGAGVAIVAGVAFWAADTQLWRIQESALRQLHSQYAAQSWTPLEVSRSERGVTFPAIGASSVYYASMIAVDFAFDEEPEASAARHLADPQWSSGYGATITGEAPTLVTTGPERGYQLLSRPIEAAELAPFPHTGRSFVVRLRGRALSEGWKIGALSENHDRWIGRQRLPHGPFELGATFTIPEEDQRVVLVWEFSDNPVGRLELDSLTLSALPPPGACERAPWQAAPVYLRRNAERTLNSQAIRSASSATLYFPISGSRRYHLLSLALEGVPPECVTGARVANDFPPGVAPIELVELDGRFEPTRRGDWRAFWREFWRWQRPARY